MRDGQKVGVGRGARTARGRRPARRTSGHAVVEMALMAPWIFFLFMAVIDIGFFLYACITTQNAARAAVMYTSYTSGSVADQAGACTRVLQEVTSMPFPSGRPSACVD